ncbi:MAG TPA: FAD-dependent oxidoreductase [Bacillales bacterium]
MKAYDLIVIGGGAGGLTVAGGAANLGMSVALIEKNEALGGDCLHYGCVPSKALIAAANKVHDARRAADEFGMALSGAPDFKAAHGRIKAAIAEVQEEDSTERFEQFGVDIYFGQGQFRDSHSVEVGGSKVLEGKRIVIAVGSGPSIPPIEGVNEVDFLTNETIFELEEAPDSMVVVGGGPVGLELGQAFARFGTNVTLIESSASLFRKEDADIAVHASQALEKELHLMLGTRVKKISEVDGQKVLTVQQNEESGSGYITADQVLLATGQKPNLGGLGLENAGVRTEEGHIEVNSALQTSVSHIYAVGDVIGTFPFTHAAGMEGKIAAANVVFGLKRKVRYENVPWVTYTDPVVFHLGLTEEEARKKDKDIRVYTVNPAEVDRFVSERDKNGLLKVITDRKNRILGAHAVGKQADDWMQEMIFAKHHGHKFRDLADVIHPYPTHGEILQTGADQYWWKILFEGKLSKLLKTYVRRFR